MVARPHLELLQVALLPWNTMGLAEPTTGSSRLLFMWETEDLSSIDIHHSTCRVCVCVCVCARCVVRCFGCLAALVQCCVLYQCMLDLLQLASLTLVLVVLRYLTVLLLL